MVGKQSKKDATDFFSLARKRFNQAVDAETTYRRIALEDVEFSVGEQWPEDIKNERNADRRPCLTINRLPQFIRQVTNEQRQNRPSIKISPVDDLADVETAKVYQGLIRHIEYNSNADVAYDHAFDGAVRSGRGFFRILADYVSPESFDQELLIKKINNHFSVYMDPTSVEPDGSDAEWAFIFEDLTEDEFKFRFPKAELSSMNDWQSIGDKVSGWISKDFVRVAEYFYKEYIEKELLLLSTGDVIENIAGQMLPEGASVVNTRKAMVPTVHWCLTNGIEKLDTGTIPIRYIPIVPVLGDEVIVDGERVLEGIVRHAKDPQRMYNYWATSETEAIALAPRAPFIGAAGSFEGYENQWKSANRKNHAFLEYNPQMVNGQLAPPPQRNAFEPAVQAITQARMMSSEDLKATTGIYDASLGNRSNENSGIAIQRRANQSQTANYHFIDNLSRSLRHAGRILLDWIPHVYDAARAVRIIGEDDQEKIVMINQEFEQGGEIKMFKLGRGKYDVTVSNGPSYQTKRQEAVESMLALASSNPQVMSVASDLLVKNMDWPGADEIAERLKKTLPSGIADEKDQKPLPPEVQAQMQQMQMMVEQLTTQLNQATETLNTKKLELDSKERIEFAKLEVDLKKELLKAGSREALALFNAEIKQLNQYSESLGVPDEQDSQGEGSYSPEEIQPTNPTGGPSPGQFMGV